MLCAEKVNRWGDIICPNCSCNIITPAGCQVVPGVGRCPLCRHKFTLDALLARRANRQSQLRKSEF
ncbi:MAG: hypothetical protein ACYS8I_07170 [Planctomycetota bacterium]